MVIRKKGHDVDWSNVPRRAAAPAADTAAAPVVPLSPPAAPASPAAPAAPVAEPAAVASVTVPAPSAAARPRTGPGYNALQIFTGNALQERITELEEEVRRVTEQRGAVALDPRSVVPSRWANRHEASYAGKAFEELKAEIRDAGANVQPIMVRPIASPKDGAPQYEIVFGHRRHRACLEVGVPVHAVIKEVSDHELFGFMERENRTRQNLSAYEQGTMYRRALDEGLFPSLRQLAAHIGRDHGDVSKALRIAALPAEVVAAFASPNDIQFRWASVLTDALERDRAAVLRVAADPLLKELAPKRIFESLIGKGGGPSTTASASGAVEGVSAAADPAPQRFDLGKGRALVVRQAGNRMVMEIDGASLAPERWAELASKLGRLLR